MDTQREVGVLVPRLAVWRRARFLTQQELADRAGLDKSTITGLEDRRPGHERHVRFENLRKLAEVLRVPPEELVSE